MSNRAVWILSLVFFLTGSAVLAGKAPTLYKAFSSAQEKSQEEKKDTEQKEQKKSKGGEGDPDGGTRKILSRVIRNFKNTLEGRSPSRLREIIDRKKFYDFPRFEEGVTDFLRSAGEMRVFIRESSVEVKDKHAVMVVDAELRFSARSDNSPSKTRRERITFDFQRTDRGWKITEIKPRSFFLP